MNQLSGELRLRAPAKINPALEVLHRRSDGYHEINTLFAAIDLADEIILRPNDDGVIRCRVVGNDVLEAEADNLCVRAAELVRRSHGLTDGVDIELVKNIPVGAGLGGGSSDAAAVLYGVETLWGVRSAEQQRCRMALALGSDVPFFLSGGIAHATGQGEILQPLEISLPFDILLVNAGIHIPTPWAYSAIARSTPRAPTDIVEALRRGIDNPELLQQGLVNDFEPAIFAAYPLLASIKARLYEAGATFALMSGSGSTIFGLFPAGQGASDAAASFTGEWRAPARFLAGW